MPLRPQPRRAAADVAEATGLTAEQVERVYRDIEQKRRTTAYLHEPPVLAAPVGEVASTDSRGARGQLSESSGVGAAMSV